MDDLALLSEENQGVRVKTWLTVMVDYISIPSLFLVFVSLRTRLEGKVHALSRNSTRFKRCLLLVAA